MNTPTNQPTTNILQIRKQLDRLNWVIAGADIALVILIGVAVINHLNGAVLLPVGFIAALGAFARFRRVVLEHAAQREMHRLEQYRIQLLATTYGVTHRD